MNGVKSAIRTPAGNLRDKVEAYITNGRYDPSKSQRIAEDYKNRRLTLAERRKVAEKKRVTVFNNFCKLVDGIYVPTVNEEHYHSLRRPTPTLRHNVNQHQQKLRTPSALMQTNKLKNNVAGNSNSKVRR